MIGTLTALQWFIYDAVKVALGIPRPTAARDARVAEAEARSPAEVNQRVKTLGLHRDLKDQGRNKQENEVVVSIGI